MLKGALHVHSTYSDGEFTLAELRQLWLAEGCAFVCMSDHAEFFDEARLQSYAEECRALSDEKLSFIAGLEFECEQRMHILGYGATNLATTKDPQAVIQHIDGQGAVSVIAHPRKDAFEWIESFGTLPQGIETWNSKYDGRYAPRPATFALMRRLSERKPELRAFYGQDLHWKKQFHRLFVLVDSSVLEPVSILEALRQGRFKGCKGDMELPSTGVLPEELLAQFESAQDRSSRIWRFLKEGKKILDRRDIRVPDAIKGQLRRIF